MVVRRVARPMLAAVFISRGAELLRNRERREQIAAHLELGGFDVEPQTAALAASGVMFGAGALLAANRLPRLSALLLAATLVPTATATHAFWAEKDTPARREQRAHFLTDVGLLGGLLLSLSAGGRRRRRRNVVKQARQKLK